MHLARDLAALPLFVLFAIVALGMWLGRFRWHSLSLGTAGVLFVAFVFGHFGLVVPEVIRDLGLVLFVYAVGLQAGPRFLGILRQRGKLLLTVAAISTLAGAIAAVVLARLFGISPSLAAGLFTGATTSTPALAAAIDIVRHAAPGDSHNVSVAYGVAYPVSVVMLVLFVQLMPALLRKSPSAAAEEAMAESLQGAPPLKTARLLVNNPNCAGRTIDSVQALRMSGAKISRVKHEGRVRAALPDQVLHLGDVVLAVGSEPELDRLAALIGPPVDEPMTDPNADVASEVIVVSHPAAAGRRVRDLGVWERFGVVITRVRREGMEFSPTGAFVLEPGDSVRVVGARQDVEQFAAAVGRQERRLEETSLLPVAAGLGIGLAVGLIPIRLPGGLETRLGMGGGVLLTALLLGHFGRLGPVRVFVPAAANFLARELGLVVFLAGTGSGAGAHFVRILQATGPQLLVSAALVTTITMATGVLLLDRWLRWNLLSTAGALCGTMTDTAGLAAASRLADSDAAAVAFASIYPIALVLKIILAQGIFLALTA